MQAGCKRDRFATDALQPLLDSLSLPLSKVPGIAAAGENLQSAPGQETAPPSRQPGASSSSAGAAERSSEATAACEARLIMEIQDEVRSSLDCVECQTSPEMRLQMQAAGSDAPAIAPDKNLTKKRARDAMEVSQQRAKACMPYQHEQALPPLQPAPPRKKGRPHQCLVTEQKHARSSK
jgi:hypothetical protein